MKRRFRDKTEIIRDVLNSLNNNSRGLTKCRLLVKANLSHPNATKILSNLSSKNIIQLRKCEDNRLLGHYVLTNQGRDLLYNINTVKEYF